MYTKILKLIELKYLYYHTITLHRFEIYLILHDQVY